MATENKKTEKIELSSSLDILSPLNRTEDDATIDALLILSRVTATVSGLNDLGTILRVGLEKTLEFMGGVLGGVMLLDERDKTLKYCVCQGLSDDFVQEMTVKLGEGINGKVALTGKAVLLDDITEEPEALRYELIKMEGLRAFISVPLRFREKVLGVLNCASHYPRHFTEKDMHILHSIGDQLGIAIGQAELHVKLQEKREQYRQVARQVITAQEEEKRRISQELHDETSQMLAALTLNLQALIEMAEIIGIQNEKFKNMLNKAHASAVQINNEVNRIISDLRPTLLDTLGFVPAIRHFAESALLPLGINIHFDIKEAVPPMPPEVEVNLFRWVQGIIGNIVQHSQAQNVKISLQEKVDLLEICIKDDGKGFDVSKIGTINNQKRRHGMGLIIAKERMKLVGGNCTVQSQPGAGTTVVAVIPLT